jgi:hypothetical protein
MSHMVHVVSMLEVMIRLGEIVFQSREVMGAVCSGDFELDNNASGESLEVAASRGFIGRVIEFELCRGWEFGRDHRRRWSPDVASKSVDCF